MAGIIFALSISIGLPLIMFVYAWYKKRPIPFILGVLAFTVSQMVIRLPILNYLEHQTGFAMFSYLHPILFAIILGLSAGVVEELARMIAMRFFMKQRDWQSGFMFGAGHGGIEAMLIVGIGVIHLFFSSTALVYGTDLFISGIERFFAMLLHIGLSIVVLLGVVRKRLIYVLIAILVHGLVDALVGILPLYIPTDSVVIVLETVIAILALIVFGFSLLIKRRGLLS